MIEQDLSLPPSSRYDTPQFPQVMPDITGEQAAEDAPPIVSLGSSATLNVQVWLGKFPWRPTAAWAAITAYLSVGLSVDAPDLDWQMAALLLLLVDPLWGSIWRLAAGRSEMLSINTQAAAYRFWLPYLQPNSPAAQLFGWDNMGSLPLLVRVAVPTIFLTSAIAGVLSWMALAATGIVVILSILGWISQRSLQRPPALLHSLVTIGLPWGLVLSQMGIDSQHRAWPYCLALVTLWVIHSWGQGRSIYYPGDRLGIGLLGAADLGIGLLLIVNQTPLWLAFLSILWLPTWLAVYRKQPLQPMSVWWLIAMLISGIALGQSL